MIDFGLQKKWKHASINRITRIVDDVVDELGSREHINYVHQILKTELSGKTISCFQRNK
jgi:carboxylate-amine ligase